MRDAPARPAATAAFVDGADREPSRRPVCPGELVSESIAALMSRTFVRCLRAIASPGVEMADWDEKDALKSMD